MVEDREVAVDDAVGDRVEEEVRALREHRPADASSRSPARSDIAIVAVDRDQEPAPEDEVDLGRLDLAVVVEVEQHDVHHVAS